MRRTLFTEDHEVFREVVTEFIRRKVLPHYEEWEEAGQVPRELYRQLGNAGIIGINVSAAAANVTLGTLRTHLDVVLPYFLTFSNDEQRKRWMPALASGDAFTAIALSEPDAGSDLAGIRTSARKVDGGWLLNGAKTFITGGLHADLVVVLARTSKEANRRDGLSLLVVEGKNPGFERGRKLKKIGLRTQDTVELSFSDVFVADANVLGEPGSAFSYLARNLAQERLAISVGAVAQGFSALDLTLAYTKEREVFGTTLSGFQNSKFTLAAVKADLMAARALLDSAVLALAAGELDAADAAAVKLFCTETQGTVLDRCLQLFGGYGYVLEYPIARLYADARVTRIYGGTSEVMKAIISKSMGM
jgi:acyl-CoA dehydrogenase